MSGIAAFGAYGCEFECLTDCAYVYVVFFWWELRRCVCSTGMCGMGMLSTTDRQKLRSLLDG